MPRFERHVFVCVNERPESDPRGCCLAKGGREIRARLKEKVLEAGLGTRVRVNAAGCLDLCAGGVAMVVYPEAVWYANVTPDDVDEIFREHLLEGRPVGRLRLRD